MGKIPIYDADGHFLGEIDDRGVNIDTANDKEMCELLSKELTDEKLEDLKKTWRSKNSDA